MAEVIGKIKIIGELQTFASGFVKAQLIVTSDEQYPSDIPIDFLKDKSDLLQNFNIGDSVKVTVNIKGSEYQGKYYVALNAWRIERIITNTNSTEPTPLAPLPPVENYDPYPEKNNSEEDEESDLPF